MSDSSNEKLEGDIAGIICKWHGGTEPCRVCLKIAPEIVALLPDVSREERERLVNWGNEHCPHAGPPNDDPTQEKMYCRKCWRILREE